jgi:hypothetical protein
MAVEALDALIGRRWGGGGRSIQQKRVIFFTIYFSILKSVFSKCCRKLFIFHIPTENNKGNCKHIILFSVDKNILEDEKCSAETAELIL